MMKKKIAIISLIFVTTVFTMVIGDSFSKEKANKKIKRIEVCAKTDAYSNLHQVEQASDLIVEGVKLDKEDNIIERDENGDLLATYTLSKFKIQEVNKKLYNEKNSTITILENEAYDENTRSIYHINGYVKMKSGKRYLLMLQKTEQNYYVPVGVNYGKIAINSKYNEIYTSDKNLKEDVKEIQNKAAKKYNFGEKK